MVRAETALLAALLAIQVGGAEAQLPTGVGVGPHLEVAFPDARPEAEAREGALFLLLPTGAQGVGLGRAMTALSSQESAFWNPAGLADVDRSRVLVSRGHHLAGEATAFSLLLHRGVIGTLGISYQLLDMGDQDFTDAQGTIRGRISLRNHLAVASFATELFHHLDVGLNFKMVQFRLACQGQCPDLGITATTFAADAGLQGIPLNGVPLRLGAMVAHAGPRLQVINVEQADPLPTRIRASVAYEVLDHFGGEEDLDLWFTLELEDRWRTPGSPSLHIGAQFEAGSEDRFLARLGYAVRRVDQSDGLAVGIGFRYDDFDVGLAKALGPSRIAGQSEPVHVTVGLLF